MKGPRIKTEPTAFISHHGAGGSRKMQNEQRRNFDCCSSGERSTILLVVLTQNTGITHHKYYFIHLFNLCTKVHLSCFTPFKYRFELIFSTTSNAHVPFHITNITTWVIFYNWVPSLRLKGVTFKVMVLKIDPLDLINPVRGQKDDAVIIHL